MLITGLPISMTPKVNGKEVLGDIIMNRYRYLRHSLA